MDQPKHKFHLSVLLLSPLYFLAPKSWVRKEHHKGLANSRIAYFLHDLFLPESA